MRRSNWITPLNFHRTQHITFCLSHHFHSRFSCLAGERKLFLSWWLCKYIRRRKRAYWELASSYLKMSIPRWQIIDQFMRNYSTASVYKVEHIEMSIHGDLKGSRSAVRACALLLYNHFNKGSSSATKGLPDSRLFLALSSSFHLIRNISTISCHTFIDSACASTPLIYFTFELNPALHR